MSSPQPQVAIIGVGLLGCSLGLALKSRGLAARVVGVGRRRESLEQAMARGAVDDTFIEVEQGVRTADLIIIATPAALVQAKLDEVRKFAPATAVVTDVTSTKDEICRYAAETWPAPRRFIGSHPMAGSENFGPEHGRADLFENTVCLVESSADLDPDAFDTVTQLWQNVGARVVHIEPEAHDRLLAASSHLPHVAAAALATVAAEQGASEDVVGNGFRDTTRIAAGRPEVWRDICLTNRAALLDCLDRLQEDLLSFRAALYRRDAEHLEKFFAEGREARRQVLSE